MVERTKRCYSTPNARKPESVVVDAVAVAAAAAAVAVERNNTAAAVAVAQPYTPAESHTPQKQPRLPPRSSPTLPQQPSTPDAQGRKRAKSASHSDSQPTRSDTPRFPWWHRTLPAQPIRQRRCVERVVANQLAKGVKRTTDAVAVVERTASNFRNTLAAGPTRTPHRRSQEQ